MALSSFIQNNQEGIIREFSAFAKTLMHSEADMHEQDLRDHAAEMLTAIAKDMGIRQTAGEQTRKSQGQGTAQTMAESGSRHADDRIQHGYSSREVLASNFHPSRVLSFLMRSKTYSDKQREAQLLKKQEELWKKSRAEGEPSETPAKADKSNKAPNKTEKKGTPERSA